MSVHFCGHRQDQTIGKKWDRHALAAIGKLRARACRGELAEVRRCRSQSLRLSSGGNCLFCLLGQLDANKVGGRIEIILSRFVDYTNVPVFRRSFIRDHAVDLAPFKVITIIVLHTQNKSAVSPFSSHAFSLSQGIA